MELEYLMSLFLFPASKVTCNDPSGFGVTTMLEIHGTIYYLSLYNCSWTVCTKRLISMMSKEKKHTDVSDSSDCYICSNQYQTQICFLRMSSLIVSRTCHRFITAEGWYWPTSHSWQSEVDDPCMIKLCA